MVQLEAIFSGPVTYYLGDQPPYFATTCFQVVVE